MALSSGLGLGLGLLIMRRRRGREGERRPGADDAGVASAARHVGPCRTRVMCAARPNNPAAAMATTCCRPAGPSPTHRASGHDAAADTCINKKQKAKLTTNTDR